ncbi:MAG: PKD domain-containing protein [Bacteroidota bacterium]
MKKIKPILGIIILSLFIISCQEQAEAYFSFSPKSPVPGTEVKFKNLSESAQEFYWEFGDDYISYEKNPVHIYEAGGTYEVSLTAYSKDKKKKHSYTDYIKVDYSTDLLITILLKSNSEPVEACDVAIYASQSDWSNAVNPIRTGKTDENGRITFRRLDTIPHYINAYKVMSSSYLCNWYTRYELNYITQDELNEETIFVEKYH